MHPDQVEAIDARWGQTTPTMRIAKEFDVPWDHVLKMADALIHDRHSSDFGELVALYSGQEHALLRADVHAVAFRWRDVFHPKGENL